MWYGKDTKELKQLKREYEEIYGANPDDYIDVEYGDDEYDDYIKDIKECIKKRDTEIEDLYPLENDEW